MGASWGDHRDGKAACSLRLESSARPHRFGNQSGLRQSGFGSVAGDERDHGLGDGLRHDGENGARKRWYKLGLRRKNTFEVHVEGGSIGDGVVTHSATACFYIPSSVEQLAGLNW